MDDAAAPDDGAPCDLPYGQLRVDVIRLLLFEGGTQDLADEINQAIRQVEGGGRLLIGPPQVLELAGRWRPYLVLTTRAGPRRPATMPPLADAGP
jgi:hypothetical protein